MENHAADAGRDANDVARLTPYELVFGMDAAFEEERFPGMLAEAEARGLEPDSPERFLLLGTAGKLLKELLPEDAAPDAVDEHGALLFHGFQFWRFGKRLYALEEPLARRLVERPAEGRASGSAEGHDEHEGARGAETAGPVDSAGGTLSPPHPSGYAQLPRHLFWARVAEDAPPEPVDGFFWVAVGDEEAEPADGEDAAAEDRDEPSTAPTRLDALFVLGLRPGRPGFSVIDVGGELDGTAPQSWLEADARPDAPDFANVLPGGEREGLHALVTAAEALKLVALSFRYIGMHPDAVGRPETADPPAEPSSHALPPSTLPYQRVRLVDEGTVDG